MNSAGAVGVGVGRASTVTLSALTAGTVLDGLPPRAVMSHTRTGSPSYDSSSVLPTATRVIAEAESRSGVWTS